MVVSPLLTMHANQSSKALTSAFERFKLRTFNVVSGSVVNTPEGAVVGVDVNVGDASAKLSLHTDESYSLHVNTKGISITAATQFGVYHALETLSQLVRIDWDGKYALQSAPWVIVDKPRFKHRGLMVDTSRHFIPVQQLQQLIDSMEYAKLNTLHWHIVDDQSFPLMLPSRPELSRHGAYSIEERYSPQDVAALVSYGELRGVRLVVEIDHPGHTSSWCGAAGVCPTPDCPAPLNPMSNASYAVISDILKDLLGGKVGEGMFPDSVMHLGGDEVFTQCWTSNPAISKWLAVKGWTTDDAYFSFVNYSATLAASRGRTAIHYQEAWENFGKQLPHGSIVQVWSSVRRDNFSAPFPISDVVKQGFRVVWSDMDMWYLSYVGVSWESVYNADPCKDYVTGKDMDPAMCCDGVIGGEGALWGEWIDGSNILQTAWPRAGAIAERLWSRSDVNDSSAALQRLVSFRCLLNRRGIPSAPVSSFSSSGGQDHAQSSPHGPSSCAGQY